MINFDEKGLKIVFNKSGNEVSMAWMGQSDERNPSEILNPYLAGLIESLVGQDLVIEFGKLEFMNSPTVPPIIQFIKKLDTNEIKTTIQYDSQSKWQCASFRALQPLTNKMSNITVKPT